MDGKSVRDSSIPPHTQPELQNYNDCLNEFN